MTKVGIYCVNDDITYYLTKNGITTAATLLNNNQPEVDIPESQTDLAQELIHAYHDNTGTSADFPNADTKKPVYLLAEYQAVGINGYENEQFTENKIRAEQGDPIRWNY